MKNELQNAVKKVDVPLEGYEETVCPALQDFVSACNQASYLLRAPFFADSTLSTEEKVCLISQL